MLIRIFSIPSEGIDIPLNKGEEWVQTILQVALGWLYSSKTNLVGHLNVTKTGDNVTLKGHGSIHVEPTCNRCLETFDYTMEVPLNRHLTPLEKGVPRKQVANESEEVELQVDDLNFSYYQGEEIDLGNFLTEEIVLALPMLFLCSSDCPGLCPHCGINLKHQRCTCNQEKVGSPFEVLKEMKIKKI